MDFWFEEEGEEDVEYDWEKSYVEEVGGDGCEDCHDSTISLKSQLSLNPPVFMVFFESKNYP